jgi:Large polyvalent protein associated domain 23
MTVATSLGAFFEDEFHHQAGIENKPEDLGLGTQDKNVLTPKGLEGNQVLDKDSQKEGVDVSFKRPLESPTEPAGALKSSGGTQVPGNTLFTTTGRIRIFPRDQQPDYDYDSWQKANPGVEMAPGQHYPDTYKLPNHMTFSDESIYHGKDGNQGGHWGTDEEGNDTFTPGPTNLKNHSMSELRDYFARVEPKAKLLLPDIADVPHHDWVERLAGSVYNSFKSALTAPGDALAGRFDPTSGEGIARALDMAGMMVGAPAPVAGKLADGTLGSFAGVKSRGVMKEAGADLGRAQILEKQGIHPDEIFDNTGWFKGADGKWRYEIDDSKAKFNPDWKDTAQPLETKPVGEGEFAQVPFNPHEGKSVAKLTDVLDHPELYKAYPFMKNTKVVHDPEAATSYWDGANNTVVMADAHTGSQGILHHELQHAIQDYEGFAKGGMPLQLGNHYSLKLESDLQKGQARVQELDDIRNHRDLTDAENTEFQNIIKALRKYPDYLGQANEQARQHYMNLAGEVEARNVDTRMLMDQDYRRKVPPSWTEDTSRHNQIVRDEVSGTGAYGIWNPEKEAFVNPKTGKETPWSDINTPMAQAPTREVLGEHNGLKLYREQPSDELNPNLHHFEFVNSEGKKGQLSLVDHGDDLSIHWVGGTNAGDNKGLFGPKDIRSLAEILKQQFPKAETVTGYRVSGARARFPQTVTVKLRTGGDLQYSVIGDFLNSMFSKNETKDSTAPTMKEFPTEGDALNAIKQGFGYGTGLEPYINAEVARIYKTQKLPTSGSLEEAQHAPSDNVDLTQFRNLDLKAKVGTVFAQAALAANRDPIAGLGFDPSKIKLQTGVGKSTIAGFYDPKDDETWLNAFKDYRQAAVHESIHRGLNILRKESPEAKEILQKMKERNRDQEEFLVRHIMDTVMGNPEEGLGEAARDQVVTSRRIFGEHSVLHDANLKDITRLREIAIQLHKDRRERGPR